MNGKTDENHYKWPKDVPKPGWLKQLFFYHNLKVDTQTHEVIGVRAKVRMFPKLLLIGGILSAGILGYESLDKSVTENGNKAKVIETALVGEKGVVVNLRDVKDALYGSDAEKYPQTPLGRIEKELGEIKGVLNDVKTHTSAMYKYSPEVRYTAIKTTLDKKDKDTLGVMIKDYTHRIGNWRLTGDDIAKQALSDLTGYVVLDKAYVRMFDEIISEMYPEWTRGKKNGEFIFTYK
jgi:hypothetical protein